MKETSNKLRTAILIGLLHGSLLGLMIICISMISTLYFKSNTFCFLSSFTGSLLIRRLMNKVRDEYELSDSSKK